MADTNSMVDEILKRVLMRIDSADLSTTSGATSNASCASAPVSSPAVSQLQTSMITEHGILSSRTGAGPQIMAADEAVKATNTEIVSIELARDMKGGAGSGSLIIFGGDDVSDVRRSVEVALRELERTFGEVYMNDAGHVEVQYTARAGEALVTAFGTPEGKAFGLLVGAPAAIGVVMADTAVKSANVDVVDYQSPSSSDMSNEVVLLISGDSGAVKQAVKAARDVGLALLETMGERPKNKGNAYII